MADGITLTCGACGNCSDCNKVKKKVDKHNNKTDSSLKREVEKNQTPKGK